MQILLANPRGFCAGVDRAISIVKNALEIYGPPVYVHNEIVHNRYVTNILHNQGAIFIKKVSEVPFGSILIFSAHGVSQSVRNEAKMRHLVIFDATCPLVTRIHMKVKHANRFGRELILIGHAGHPEVEGTIGQYNNEKGGIYLVESPKDVWRLKVKNENHLSFITQTTLSVDETSIIIEALNQRFPKIIRKRKNDICYATVNRQRSVRVLAEKSDIVLVIGSKNSSNANRLVELVYRMKKKVFLIEDENDIQKKWFKLIKCVGITAGASTPDILVKKVINYLQKLGANEIIPLEGDQEKIFFKMPKELRVNNCRNTNFPNLRIENFK